MPKDKKHSAKGRHRSSIGGELINESTKFHIIEAYKNLRTNLLFTLSTAKTKIALISSSEPSAGKSSVSSNLAITLSQTGAKTVLVDADMRKPTQHKIFSLSNNLGLSYILSGLCNTNEAIQKSVQPNLDIITAGSIPPNPSELLSSSYMTKLINFLEEEYDYIIIDTPPVGVISDALSIAPRSAGILLVARYGQTTYDSLQKTCNRIERVQGNLLGVIINDVDSNFYYGGYDYKYSE